MDQHNSPHNIERETKLIADLNVWKVFMCIHPLLCS